MRENEQCGARGAVSKRAIGCADKRCAMLRGIPGRIKARKEIEPMGCEHGVLEAKNPKVLPKRDGGAAEGRHDFGWWGESEAETRAHRRCR